MIGMKNMDAAFTRVADLMTRDVITVSPDTPVLDVAHLLYIHRIGSVPVIDQAGCVAGIITTKDLFIKPAICGQGHHTYLTLFHTPVIPSMAGHIYFQRGAQCLAKDIMSKKVIWISEFETLSQAIQTMTRFGVKQLPVLTSAPQDAGRLVGLLTRSDVINFLAHQKFSLATRISV